MALFCVSIEKNSSLLSYFLKENVLLTNILGYIYFFVTS